MNLDFKKQSGLIPAIIQDAETQKVLMLAYMNEEALELTLKEGFVTFYSRSRQILWKKGANSGRLLKVIEILPDCDNDTLLIKVTTRGHVCHAGSDTCFKELNPKGDAIR